MPVATTCDGANVPPPLRWSGLPRQAAELAVTLEDVDAAGGSFIHWAVAGLDPHSTGLPAGAPPGSVVGVNDFGRVAYGGPCPPRGGGAHRYRFVIYALRTRLELAGGFRVSSVGTRLAKDTLAVGALTGTYGR